LPDFSSLVPNFNLGTSHLCSFGTPTTIKIWRPQLFINSGTGLWPVKKLPCHTLLPTGQRPVPLILCLYKMAILPKVASFSAQKDGSFTHCALAAGAYQAAVARQITLFDLGLRGLPGLAAAGQVQAVNQRANMFAADRIQVFFLHRVRKSDLLYDCRLFPKGALGMAKDKLQTEN